MEFKSQVIFEIEPTEPANFQLEPEEEKELIVRLDKWLWAARFFKTRALARSAIEHGRVWYNGEKTIPSKEIAVGDTISINQSPTRKPVILKVCKLSTRRRSTDESSELFQIIPASSDNFCETKGKTEKTRKVARFLRRALAISDSQDSESPK